MKTPIIPRHPVRGRRDLLKGLAALGATLAFPLSGAAQSMLGPQLLDSRQSTFQGDASVLDQGTWIILLGTKGGPTPSTYRGQNASVLLVEGRPYVIDAGSGVTLNLEVAGIDLAKLQNVFITHHHSDHNIDMGNLVLQAWGTNKRDRFDLYGPAPIKQMMRDFLSLSKVDIDIRQDEEGRPELVPLVHAHEVPEDGGEVMSDDRVKVSCVPVPHFKIPTYAYRFDAPTRSVVFSGDTGPSDRLVELATGADVLVHEVMYKPAIQKMFETVDDSPRLIDHLEKAHTTTEQLGKIATRAKVKTLVLYHFVPGSDPSITDEMWVRDIRKDFDGEIVVGRDMMLI